MWGGQPQQWKQNGSMQFPKYVLQWSLHFKTTHSARKYGLKLEVVLKWKDIYIENITVMSLISCLKMEGIVKYRGLKLQGPLYIHLIFNGKVSATDVLHVY